MKHKAKKMIKFLKQYEGTIIDKEVKKEIEKQYKIINRKNRKK